MEVIALLQKYGGKVRSPDSTQPQPPCTTSIDCGNLVENMQFAYDDDAAMLLSLD